MASKSLKANIIIGGSLSGAFRSAMASTKNGLAAIGKEIADVERKQRLMSRSIETFGRQGKNVDGLRKQYAELTREAERLRAAQSRLADISDRIERNANRRRQLGGQLRGASMTFGAVTAAALAPVRTASQFETAMLGVAKQLEGARDQAGKLTPVFFGMQRQVQQLGREIPLATNDLADMVAAGLRMGVANDEVVAFTRTAAMMADAFELPAGQLADDMGKIAGLFHIPIPRIGELADAINFLDDNAISKGGDIIDVMRRIGGMAQTLGMPAKEAAALGSTFLTLGSSAEVAGTASNAVMRILGAATAQSKKIQKGFASIGLDPAKVQAAMSRDSTGTILMLLDKLNGLSAEQRIVAASRIFGAEYGDDIAKLATGADEYRRQLELVNGEQAKGSMAREFSARLETTAAQWQLTKNRMSEVVVVIGSALVPAVNDLMQTAAPAIEGFAEWSRENPRLIKGIIGSAIALAGLRVAAIGAAFAWAALKTPVLATMGFIAKWKATGAIAALGRFGPTAKKVALALRTVGTAIAAIGGGPIALAVGALTVGALVVRKYWQPISAFLGGMFDGMRQAVGPAIETVSEALGPLKPTFDVIGKAVGGVWDWFMKLLAPVQLTAGEFDKAQSAGVRFGRAVGSVIGFVARVIARVVNGIRFIVDNAGRVGSVLSGLPGVGPIAGMLTNLVRPGGAQGARLPTPVRGRTPPAVPALAAAGGAAAVTDASTHTYNITQLPGESAEDLARRIEAERRRQAGVAGRGSLSDPVS